MMPHEVQRYNQRVLDTLEPGDLLEFDRGVIKHWAVYIGNGEVVHLLNSGRDQKRQCGECVLTFCKGIVSKKGFWDVAGDRKVDRNNLMDTKLKHFEPSEIVKRALSTLGKDKYNTIFKNCEHFATWCRYDKAESKQVNSVLTALGGGLVFGGVLTVASIVFFGRRK